MNSLLRRISLIFAGLILFGSAALATFSDVQSTHPNYEAINYLLDQNIVNGYPDGMFRPDDLVNRAEFIKIMMEAYQQEMPNYGNCFTDVATEWFAKYICFGKMNNLISGYPDGTFKPGDNINFVEVAKVLVNVRGFSITPNLDLWYKPYVEKLAELNAIPTSITSFNQKITRGEMAEMLYRLMADVRNKPFKTYDELSLEQASYGLPVNLKIPEINVDATIEYVGLTSKDAVDVPKDPANVAWFDLGPRPGNNGSAVITGHVNWFYGATGVFTNLHKLKPGDKVIVEDEQGTIISFVVRESRIYSATDKAVDVFTSNDGKVHLNLITCDGAWDRDTQQYTERLVVFTDKEE